MRASSRVLISGVAAVSALVIGAEDAHAESLIKRPNAHPDYVAELDPHGTLALWRRRFGPYRSRRYSTFGDPEVGAGFRATIEIMDEGFIPDLNNTVGITFGIDITSCPPCRKDFTFYTPVGLQWNFFFTEHWSAFGDVGAMLRTDGFFHEVYGDFMLMLGGRYHFNDDVALTLRVGYPFITFGPSFFVG